MFEIKATLRQVRRLIVLIVGVTVVLVGVVLIVLPGPAFVVIPLGFAILATEFVWARRLIRKAREQGEIYIRPFFGKSRKDSDSS